MSTLPLSPIIYHKKTKPAHQYFYSNVYKSSHLRALQSWESRGRVLLLVFPPDGSMAEETVKEYIRVDPERNDTVVYVGEGRGGANANDDFFDIFLDGSWSLVYESTIIGTDIQGSSDKSFEKCFCFQRIKKDCINRKNGY